MKDVEVPRSIPKMTTRRVLTMSFVEGDPITRLKVSHLSRHIRQLHDRAVQNQFDRKSTAPSEVCLSSLVQNLHLLAPVEGLKRATHML